MTGSVLVLGGNGRFGRHAAEAFWNRGWRVTLFDRERHDLMTAAHGQDVIVNGWNPSYELWATQVPALTQRVIEAAKASGSTVIVPGNVYVFGADAPELLTDVTPHTARNPLGRIRRDMEAAYRASGVQTIVLRAGDFLDTEPSGNWFDKVIATKIGKGRLTYPGRKSAPHAWAYLPDLARAATLLADQRDRLGQFTDIPFAGYTLTAEDLATVCGEVMGRPISVSAMSWLPIHLARPFWPLARYLVEMRYLWSKPHRLDPVALQRLLPEFRSTPLQTALVRVLSAQIDPDEPMSENRLIVEIPVDGFTPQHS
ncbi:MAG: epimerase [Pseudomonadota bacterium]